MSSKTIFNVLFLTTNLIIFISQLTSEKALSAKAQSDAESILEEATATFKKQYDLMRVVSRNISSCDDSDIRLKTQTLDRLITALDQDLEEEELASKEDYEADYEESAAVINPFLDTTANESLTPIMDEFGTEVSCAEKVGKMERFEIESFIYNTVDIYNAMQIGTDQSLLTVSIEENGMIRDEMSVSEYEEELPDEYLSIRHSSFFSNQE